MSVQNVQCNAPEDAILENHCDFIRFRVNKVYIVGGEAELLAYVVAKSPVQ